MKPTRVHRQIDTLGRFVLPIDFRRQLDIDKGDEVEIFAEGDRIILQKYSSSCLFCGNRDGLLEYNEKHICKDCRDKIADLK